MKAVATFLSLAVALYFASNLLAQEEFTPDPVVKEHQWLKQFVGTWETTSKAQFGPDLPVFECTGTMTSRMLGEYWVVSEVEGNMQGETMNAVQTIGYDPGQKKYVGTWVDSMMNHLWKYEGTVDDTGKKLSLDADGPDFTQPGKTTKYRDAYEFTSADEVIATSSYRAADGTWVTFMTGKYTRKK